MKPTSSFSFILVSLVLGTIIGAIGGLTFAEHQQAAQGAPAFLLQADSALRANHPDEALQLAYASIDRRPTSAAFELVGDILSRAQNRDLVEGSYRRALKLLQSDDEESASATGASNPGQRKNEIERLTSKISQFERSTEMVPK